MAINPYLTGMADDIGRRSNMQLQQGLQGIRSNSAMDGGFGGSRQGVAEGAAISNSTDSLQGNLANMYNADYQAGENRTVQRYGIDSQSASSKYGADQSLAGSMYGADQALAAAKLGATNSLSIAGLNNATAQRGQDQNYNLGMGQNETSRQNSNNQYQLGLGQNANQSTANKNNYTLGLGNLGLSAQNSAQQYDLGLRSSDLGFANLDANTYQNNVNNQFKGADFGMGVQNQLQSGNNSGLSAATQIQNTPINYYNQFSDKANSLGQGYGTSAQTTQMQGNPLLGALGGAQLGQQFAKNLGFGGSEMAMTNGGGFSNTPNYLITS